MKGIEAAFVGVIGKEPQLRTAASGREWLSLSVAVGEGDDTQWVSVAYFAHAAEMAGRLKNGDRVYVEGRLKLRQREGTNGERCAGLSVSASLIQPMGQIGDRKPKKARAPATKQDRPDLLPGVGGREPAVRANGGRSYDKPFDDELPF